MEWKDQYKHPNWQKKRLEALDKSGFACQSCYDSETQLHVHHKQYIKGRKIWEYEVSELSVLCEPCHAIAHEYKEILSELVCLIHPEGFADAVAVMAGYCNSARNPSGIDADKIIERLESPYTVVLGALSASFSNTGVPIHTIVELIEKLDSVPHEGGVDVVIHIPKRRAMQIGGS